MKTILTLDGYFPHTLTLSRGEREQPLDTFLKLVCRAAIVRHDYAEVSEHKTRARHLHARALGTLGTFLPLPEGEGQGEGKRVLTFQT